VTSYFRTLKRASFSVLSPHFWIIVAMFLIGIVFYYPQQILHTENQSLLSFLGLTHHTVERTLFLVPIIYAGMFFGSRGGIAALAISLVIILPRVFLISVDQTEALLQSGAVAILGVLVNLWFEVKRRENALYRQLVDRLEESERGMTVSEQKYRYLFEHASDAIWVQDVNGYLVDGNRAFERLTGLKVAEVKGTHLGKFMSAESLLVAREVRNKLMHGEEFEQPYEQQFQIEPGVIKTVKMSTNAVMSGGRITGFEHVARDVTQEKQRQENLHAYIKQFTMAQEEERKRIARDLHDDVSPNILILIQKLDNLTSGRRTKASAMQENIAALRGQAVQALESLRATAQGLRPRILDDLGLVAALEWIAEELEKSQGIKTEVQVSGFDRKLTPEMQIVLFRIAQEALNNIRKHAQASRATITVACNASYITMTVADNGRGFAVNERLGEGVSAGRLGLMGMFERASLLNGSLKIKSEPGKGTELTVTLPWTTRE
jgi:two-component system sensor histidine kinase DegS